MAVELGVLVRNCQFSNYLFLIPALLVTVSSTWSYFVHIKVWGQSQQMLICCHNSKACYDELDFTLLENVVNCITSCCHLKSLLCAGCFL